MSTPRHVCSSRDPFRSSFARRLSSLSRNRRAHCVWRPNPLQQQALPVRVSLLVLMLVAAGNALATGYPGIDPVRLGYGDTSAFRDLIEGSDGSAIFVIGDAQSLQSLPEASDMRAGMARSLSGSPGLADEVKHLIPLTSDDLARTLDPAPLRTLALQEVVPQTPAEVITARPVSNAAQRKSPRVPHMAKRHHARYSHKRPQQTATSKAGDFHIVPSWAQKMFNSVWQDGAFAYQ